MRSTAGLLISLLTLGTVTVVACSKTTQRPGIDPAPQVRAPRDIDDSFAKTQGLASNDRAQLVIKKSALEKEFLLHASIIPQTGAATGRDLQARVVAFRQLRETVFLLEAVQGHVVTRDLPSSLILAEFPIVKDSEDELVIDFNAGMRQAFTTEAWFASDMEKPEYTPTFEATPLTLSYIESIRTFANVLEIRQIAQTGDDDVRNAEIRYFLTPYAPSAGYKFKDSDNEFKNVGYFENTPTLEERTGRSLLHITKWDDSKTITYHVSANTPPEYVQAVKDGILYWNKAFGREVLRAEIAPAGATAPDTRYNIIQWVPDASAGAAYANVMTDPRTGEVLHAEVYLTSVFAVARRSDLPAILRKLRQSETLVNQKGLRLKLRTGAWGGSRLCSHPVDSGFAQELQVLAASGATDTDFLRVSQDYIRFVVAHEVGHTLGLRHNFAGSLASNVTLVQRDRLFLDYILQGKIPLSETFTSSVMDYLNLADAVLGLVQSAATGAAQTYDRLAIGWGYGNERMVPASLSAPLFCTDGHMEKYKDCGRFDFGARPVVSNVEKIDSLLQTLPLVFAEKYIQARTALDTRDRREATDVALKVSEIVDPVISTLRAQIGWFTHEGVPSIAVERSFPFATDFNEREILTLGRERVRDQIAEIGSVDKILFSLLPATDRKAPALARAPNDALAAYLARPDVRNGIGYDTKPYSLSDADISFIRQMGATFFSKVEESLLDKSLDALAGVPEAPKTTEDRKTEAKPPTPPKPLRYAEEVAGAEIEARLAAVAEHIVLSQTEVVVPGPAVEPPPESPIVSNVRAFQYKKALRVKAAKLLARALGTTSDFSFLGRRKIDAGLKEIVKQSLGEIDKIDVPTLSRQQRQWLLDQQDLLKLLASE